MPTEINGLPLHILLVHVVVIVVPAGALMTALGALWPAFRQKLGILTPVVTLIGLASVPLATNAGEWLQQRVGQTPLLAQHVALGDTLLPWAVAQFLVAVVIWAWYRFFAAVRTTPPVPARRASTPVPLAAAAAGASATPGPAPRDPFAPPADDAGVAVDREPGIDASATRRAGTRLSVIVSIVLIVIGLGVSAGTVIKVVQVGESGSNAVWSGSFSEEPVSR